MYDITLWNRFVYLIHCQSPGLNGQMYIPENWRLDTQNDALESGTSLNTAFLGIYTLNFWGVYFMAVTKL